MHILYIHQYFTTNEGSGGTRSYDVSRHLVDMGHQVTVICGASSSSGLKPVARFRPWRVQWVDGIKVIGCNVPYSNYMCVPERLWSFFGFALLAIMAALLQQRIDIVFATSTPLTVTIPGILASKLKRKPYVFEVRDLWPEDLVAAGRMQENGFGHRVQSIMERASYAVADRVLLVSQGFHDRLLERGYPRDLLKTIPLGAAGELFKDVQADRSYLQEHGLAEKTIAIYTGAHGNANGLYQVLEAAEKLLDRPDIAVVLLGDGKEKPNLLAEVEKRNLKNVYMLAPVPKAQVPGILAGCHIGLMILKQIARPRWVTPNKLFDYMFSGMPVLVNFAGTTSALVEAEGCGFACKPGCADDLADKIRCYTDNPDKRKAVGIRARDVAWTRFERRMIARDLAEDFTALASEIKL
jgi:glycosyltransferase involved in cell wall biosynthesis